MLTRGVVLSRGQLRYREAHASRSPVELHAGVTDQQVAGEMLSSDELYARSTSG
ncbi:MAG TPA: hypothetical protein VG125_06705 [Pirellulales bacterium]|nr:hypothetical protein [Pirellulales bacterium]